MILLMDYIKILDSTYFSKKGKKYQAFQYEKTHLSNVFKLLAYEKKLTLREIEQLFAKINIVIQSTPKDSYLFPALLAFLIITKEFHSETYEHYIIKSSTPDGMIKLLYEIVPESIRLDSYECALIEAFLICAKAGEDETRLGNSLQKHHDILASDSDGKAISYSNKVIRIVDGPVENYDISISLESLVSRIDYLKNFSFHMNEGEQN